MTAVADELARLESEAESVLRVAREQYEAAVLHAEKCRAELLAAQDTYARMSRRAGNCLRPRVLMASEERRLTR